MTSARRGSDAASPRHRRGSTDLASSQPYPACCLAWAVTKAIPSRQLRALHNEVAQLAQLVGAETIEFGASHGVLSTSRNAGGDSTKASKDVENESTSESDAMVRLGQLISRWASEEEPEVTVRIGVHIGEIEWIILPTPPPPGQVKGYFGSAVTTAKYLAETAPKENCVHLLRSTKETLKALESISFHMVMSHGSPPTIKSYYLEPWEQAREQAREDGAIDPKAPGLQKELSLQIRNEVAPKIFKQNFKDLTLEEFAYFLESYGVSTAKFGRGQAKPLESFYNELASEKRSYLFENKAEGTLERKVEIVRVSLVAGNIDEGTDYCLMVAYEIMQDGRPRFRNQKLAVVVPDGVGWQEAVRNKFQRTFKLSKEVFEQSLKVEGSFFKEERMISPSIPGLMTTYRTHEIRLRVQDIMTDGLQAIGLPYFTPFATDTPKDAGVSGGPHESWAWAAVGGVSTDKAESLHKLLAEYKIRESEFEAGAFDALLEEVYDTRISTLMVRNKELTRNLQIIKVWVYADIHSVPHCLVHVSKTQRGKCDSRAKNRPISARMPQDKDWKAALYDTMHTRLGVPPEDWSKQFELDEGTYRQCEEVEYSRSYPGLKSVYRIHEVTCRVSHTLVQLGLPDGHDFAFSRQENDGSLVITNYAWKPLKDIAGRNSAMGFKKGLLDDSEGVEEAEQYDPKRRLPVPPKLQAKQQVGLQRSWTKALGSSSCMVGDLMAGRNADWARAKNAAKRIRDQDYNLKMFTDDCVAAFPELALYMGVTAAGGEPSTLSSGRSADDEYQRTMGALYAVYWLMRWDTDGPQSFSFGVDDNWNPLTAESERPRRDKAEVKKRSVFLEQVDWSLFAQVLVAAGLLTTTENDGDDGTTRYSHDEERTLAMLALTAIHDIMKVEQLCPVVDGWIGAFSGYKPGEVITDHDVALGYVLENLPDALPSYAGLPQTQRDSVKFTQCNMEYNMGWLVQAEAPPGALFTKFRQIIRAGKADPRDVAFYFTHWITDLAGAEPCPQEGAEKFVLKFPRSVLTMFLNSFEFVQYLSTKSETQVFEDYLDWRWKIVQPSLGNAPAGSGSVAQQRITVMAQGSCQTWLDAYGALDGQLRDVLATEFALTGAPGQSYSKDPCTCSGPAFLVYYAPALLQKNSSEAGGALGVLATVLRQARDLWPLEAGSAGETVTVFVDALKELTVQAMQITEPGEVWAVVKNGAKSAQVKKVILSTMQQDGLAWSNVRLLSFQGLAQAPRPMFQDEVAIKGLVPLGEAVVPVAQDVQQTSAVVCSMCWAPTWMCANR